MPGSSYLVDTNILLRLVQPDSPEYGTIRKPGKPRGQSGRSPLLVKCAPALPTRNSLKTRRQNTPQVCRSFPLFGAQWSHDRHADRDRSAATARFPACLFSNH